MGVAESTSLSHLTILLLLSGQVETNPGPSTSAPETFPCAICGDEVRDNDPALLCDHCDCWCHISCVGISPDSYDILTKKSRSFAWVCCQCSSTNIGSSSSLQGLNLSQTNRFSPLHHDSSNEEILPSINPLTSTPTSSPGGCRQPRFHPPSRNRKKAFKVMVVNCNGLKGNAKKSSFHAAIAHHTPDFVFGCESKLDDSLSSYSIFPSNYSIYRKDRNIHGGGVFIAIIDTLIVTECPEFDSDCEIQWCNVQLANAKPLYIGSYYCPPNNRQQGLEGLHQSLSKIMTRHRRSHPNILIAGDFNHPDINWDDQSTTNPATSTCHQKLLDILLHNSLSQTVREVTRPSSNNILDLVVTSNPALVENVCVKSGISDHNIVTFTLAANPKISVKPLRKIYQFHKADEQQLRDAAAEFATEFLQSDPERRSVETNWSIIVNFLNRNQVAKNVHRARCEYVNNITGASLKDNPKSFWSYIKTCRSENIGIPTLRTPSKLCASALDKAETLNDYFQSVFTPHQLQPLVQKGPSPFPTIGHLHVHRTGVEKRLQQLDPSKASGPDELPPKLLKLVAREIASPLSFLFQQSYNSGIVPAQWKQALVTPIHKSGEKCDPSNYRPISLTCVCCKVMEHIILSHVSKHVAVNNILTDAQHGFRRGLSTTTQLTTAVHDWSSILQQRSQADIIFLDFKKAFDRVPHLLLSTKLQYYGISGDSLQWIMSLLTDRQQAVVVDGSKSTWRDVTSGVPQGSVIGPTLFLLYINDIQDNIQSTMRLFADDSTLYREIRCPEDHQILKDDLQQLSRWSSNWMMDFNVKKCAILTITRKRTPSIREYHLSNGLIPRVKEYKYLGVTVAADLRWNKHCQTIRHKASRTLGLLRRTLSPCTRDVKSRAYTALVRPQLEYASEAWNPHSVTVTKMLEQVQRTAARFVYRDYRYTTSPSALVAALGWDTLHTRRILDQCTLLYKIHHRLVSIPAPTIVIPATYFGRHDHNLKYVIPVATIDSFKFSYYPRAIRIWNHLPGSAVNATGITNFQEAALPSIRTMQPPIGSHII
ncbi:uncharacterized protein LOC105443737 [Strongylocentrotus purpuratus]|uniref:Reverse transcriptase n=1 Tax=Strongylocentrotus purpuratus TaxID=7668 RepID=A0A7M7HKH1_STRPU|nr:uncharacterized protein LOC105443737 [Strongylocentrotus purpuratus]